MAEYRIICVFRGSAGEIRALGYSQNGTGVMYDDVWKLPQARAAIEDGHHLYTVSPVTAEQADLEVYNDELRTKPEETSDNALDDLPECG